MVGLQIGLIALFSFFSTGVMSYIGMATPIGPWITSTLVLGIGLVLRFSLASRGLTPVIALIVSSASIGGILATALGFTLPTLYFLDKQLFLSWIEDPSYFITMITGISIVAGLYGFWLADVFEERLLIKQQLEFPIAQLTYRMICAHNQLKKAWEMCIGFFSTLLFCVLQDGVFGFNGIIARSVIIVESCSLFKIDNVAVLQIPLLRLEIFPSFWAIGYVTGHVIAIPLFIGLVSKLLLMDPIQTLGFMHLSYMSYILAFCSGVVLVSALQSVASIPPSFFQAMADGCKAIWFMNKVNLKPSYRSVTSRYYLKFLGFILIISYCFLWNFNFSIGTMIYLLGLSIVCAYQVMVIAGRTGLALLGRFATFMMVPALVFFRLDIVQLVFIAIFVEVCTGVATDIMVGRKLALLAGVPHRQLRQYQLIGLLMSCCFVGGIFWLLINAFGLGTPDLFAQRAQARALLINVRSFDTFVLILGSAYGLALKWANVNPVLVLGGLLMPINISFGLIIGGALSLLSKKKEEWYPFWSGVFASNSLWMIIRAL